MRRLPASSAFLMSRVKEGVVPPAAYLPEGWVMKCFSRLLWASIGRNETRTPSCQVDLFGQLVNQQQTSRVAKQFAREWREGEKERSEKAALDIWLPTECREGSFVVYLCYFLKTIKTKVSHRNLCTGCVIACAAVFTIFQGWPAEQVTHFTRQGNMTSIVFLLSFQGGGAASQVKQTGEARTSELLKIFHNNISLEVIKTVVFFLAKVNSK